MGFDSDYNGKLEPVLDYDNDTNNIPDVHISAFENKSFLIYLRADYSLHFLTKYQKIIEPTEKGFINFYKLTLYDTAMMRIFIIPHEDVSVQNDVNDIDFEKRLSEGASGETLYYYGEWSGGRDNEVKVRLKDEKIKTNDTDSGFFMFLIIFILAILLLTIIVFRSHKRKTARIKEAKKRRALQKEQGPDKSKSGSRKVGKKTRKQRLEVKEKQKREQIEDSPENNKSSIERKQKIKTSEALKRLEEDYQSGRLDKEIYEELKKRYI
jgi:hypothetical protein